ncbi:MAG: phospholipase D-like domain-containing protein, partial [Pseudomonadota bacterium]
MRRAIKALLVLLAAVVVAILLARILFALPNDFERSATATLPAAGSGPLAEALAGDAAAHPGLTGVTPLVDGAGAWATRMALAEAATTSIDARYYIWSDDLTGTLLLDALRRAAERGVRVRLMLDDNGTSGLDGPVGQLDAHPNAEVRLWNPFNIRQPKLLAYAFDFFRLNRRMHNKSFTVDGLVTILGGRNVGDEYFGTGPTPLYVDLDVLAAGAAVAEEQADFDLYWTAPSAYPAAVLIDAPQGDPLAARIAELEADPQWAEYRAIIAASDTVEAFVSGDLALEWVPARVVSDDPAKGLGQAPDDALLAARLAEAMGVFMPYLAAIALTGSAFAQDPGASAPCDAPGY